MAKSAFGEMSQAAPMPSPISTSRGRESVREDISAFLDAAHSLSDKQFSMIRQLARKHAGIAIAEFKISMVRRRLSQRLTTLGLADFGEYCALLEGPAGAKEIEPLINALTTNKTEFFREQHHFEHLASSALPRLLAARMADGSRRLRIWSAGCSSGEEPYTIALTLLQSVPRLVEFDAKILATDIDSDILSRAQRGEYADESITQIPPPLRSRYVMRLGHGERPNRISPAVRSLVVFKHLNLHDHWPVRGRFDVIFCRNVVIYFDKLTQRRLFDRFADVLHPDGLLYCGHSESLFGVSTRFRPIGKSVYERIL